MEKQLIETTELGQLWQTEKAALAQTNASETLRYT